MIGKLLENASRRKVAKNARKFNEQVKAYNKLGEFVYRNKDISEVVPVIRSIVESACEHNLTETEEWFDSITVKRHNKQLQEAYKTFEKSAKEARTIQQRMESAYEDIGSILSRYYDI